MTPRIRWVLQCVLLLSGVQLSAFGGNPDAEEPAPTRVTVCDLTAVPEQYAGKMVEVRGWVAGRTELSLLDTQPTNRCRPEVVLVVLPRSVRPKPDFDVWQDENFLRFQQALQERVHIEGTFEARFDTVYTVRDGRRTKASKGYGKRRAAMRLVVRKIRELDITATRSVDR